MMPINITRRAGRGENPGFAPKGATGYIPARKTPHSQAGSTLKGRCMNKKKTQRDPEAVAFAQARDELFSHILRCGVIDALPEHQKDWFDDTMLYLADRYEDLSDEELSQLRVLGERFSKPVQRKVETVETGAA